MALFKNTKKTKHTTTTTGRGVERRSSDGGVVEPGLLCKAYDFLARDPNYMLRLCQKSKWRSIKRCCEIISGLFEKKAPAVDPSLCNKARQQFLQTDAWGNTPLHIMCYRAPPLAVVVALLEASRLAPGNPIQVLTITNDQGSTPLVIASKTGGISPRIIKMMVLDGNEVTIHDNSGSSAFDALMSRYSLLQLLPSMRSRYVALIDITNKDDLICYGKLPAHEGTRTRMPTSGGKLNDLVYSISQNSDLPSAFPYFWGIMAYLMLAAWKSHQHAHGSRMIDIDYISHLHGAALIADVLPTEVSDMILRTYTTAADNHQEKEEEKSQTKPLHLALSRPISPHPKARLQHAHMVKQLIARDPSAVKSNMPGTDSRSVFCQAIAMGNHWNVDDDGGDDKKASGGTNTREGPVQLLFRECPDGVSQRDCETGLYPFMLAAAARTAAKKEDAEEELDQEEARDHCDRLQLDTIYNLLRTSPECIHG